MSSKPEQPARAATADARDLDTYTFSVSEVFPDGRVLVTTYVRIGDQITMTMDCYDDMTLQGGKRYLNLQQTNGAGLPRMQAPATDAAGGR